MFLNNKITQFLAELEEKKLLRQRKIRPHALLAFDSNDYLCLATHPKVIQGYEHGFARFSAGSGGSMMINGYHPAHQALERKFAEILNVDECMLFSSGYAANLAITLLLGRLKACVLIDKELHASWYDGISLANVHFNRFLHNNLEDLAKKLCLNPQGAVITEGIFSMSGQAAPLDLISISCQNNFHDLLVDEAHSFGVLGREGLGAVSSFQLSQQQVPLRVIPFGKAMAAQGALIAGQSQWVQALQQAGRPVIYSTALSPAYSYGLSQTIEVLQIAEDRRARLQELITQFRFLVQNSPFNWADSVTPIQQLRLGCPQKALDYSKKLSVRGIYCSALRQPTVSKSNTGLRVILNSSHTEQDLYRLFKELGVIYATST